MDKGARCGNTPSVAPKHPRFLSSDPIKKWTNTLNGLGWEPWTTNFYPHASNPNPRLGARQTLETLNPELRARQTLKNPE